MEIKIKLTRSQTLILYKKIAANFIKRSHCGSGLYYTKKYICELLSNVNRGALGDNNLMVIEVLSFSLILQRYFCQVKKGQQYVKITSKITLI